MEVLFYHRERFYLKILKYNKMIFHQTESPDTSLKNEKDHLVTFSKDYEIHI